MKQLIFAISLLALLLSISKLGAQEHRPSHFTAGPLVPNQGLKTGAKAKTHELAWAREAALLGGGMLLNYGGKQLVKERTLLSPEQAQRFTRQDVPWFDRSATYKYNRELMDLSDQLGMFTFAAPLALLLDSRVRQEGLQTAVMFAETYLLASALPNYAKGSILRYRPYVYNPSLSYEQKVEKDPGKAFFANQATLTFASAAFVSSVFEAHHPGSKWNKWVWIGTMSGATAIAFVRHETGLHYNSDLLVGAAIGTAIGYTIPWLHRANRSKWAVRPIAGQDTFLLSASRKL
jgi:membrane-associated phospholipid phosphatase